MLKFCSSVALAPFQVLSHSVWLVSPLTQVGNISISAVSSVEPYLSGCNVRYFTLSGLYAGNHIDIEY